MFLLVKNTPKPTPKEGKIDDAFILKEIKSCLDSKLKYAILTSGRQGGKIYQSQGGKSPLLGQFLNYYDSYFIPYYLPYYSPRDFYYSGNLYFPYVCDQEPDPNYSLPFDGLNPFEQFELKSGCQRSNATTLVLNIPAIDSDLSENSFQSQILSYMKTNVDECYDIDKLIYPYVADVENEPKLNLIISKNDIVLEVKRGVTITKDGKKIKEITVPIEITGKIRLREHYDFLKEVLLKELKNASFNPALASKDGFSVSVLRDVADNPYHNDVIIVKDLKSYIDGENFEIWVARTNNYPIISYSPSQISLTSQDPFIKPLEIGIPVGTISEIISEYAQKYPSVPISTYIYDENTFNKLEHNFSEFLINGIQDKSGIFTVYDREEDIITVTNKTNFTHFGLPFEVNVTACENHDSVDSQNLNSALCVEKRFLFNMVANEDEQGNLQLH